MTGTARTEGRGDGDISRRAALGRLGLGALAIYAAPTVTRIDSARAAFPSQCPPNRPACGAQGNSKPGG